MCVGAKRFSNHDYLYETTRVSYSLGLLFDNEWPGNPNRALSKRDYLLKVCQSPGMGQTHPLFCF